MKFEIIQKDGDIYIRKKSLFGLLTEYLDCYKTSYRRYSGFFWEMDVAQATVFPSVEEAKLSISHYETAQRQSREYWKNKKKKHNAPIKVLEEVEVNE